jgi:hypothetical protein
MRAQISFWAIGRVIAGSEPEFWVDMGNGLASTIYVVFQKELYTRIANAAVWRVLQRRLHLKACTLRSAKGEDFEMILRARRRALKPNTECHVRYSCGICPFFFTYPLM